MRLWNGRTCLRPYIKNAVTDFPATAFFYDNHIIRILRESVYRAINFIKKLTQAKRELRFHPICQDKSFIRKSINYFYFLKFILHIQQKTTTFVLKITK